MQADNDDKPKGLQPKCSRGVPLSESPTGVLAASKRLKALSRHPCAVFCLPPAWALLTELANFAKLPWATTSDVGETRH